MSTGLELAGPVTYWTGLHRAGLDWTGLTRLAELNWIGLVYTGLDWTEWTELVRARLTGKTGL